MRARCPAKVNLSLRVLGRRPDGYHELETVFQAIDLWDDLKALPASTLTLACDDPRLATDRSNLVVRAAERLREAFPARASGASVRLRKRIPVGGGLGGGSSDAAGTLLLLTRLWGLPASPTELDSLARELGADVPFFLHGGRVLGTGRGDVLQPFPSPDRFPILLGCPPFSVSTEWAYRSLASWLTLPSTGASVDALSAHKWQEENDFRFAGNDLERAVFAERPELVVFRNALLEQGAAPALLSGSGSAIFGVFAEEATLDKARAALARRFADWRLISTRAVGSAAHVVDLDSESEVGRTGE